MVKDQLSCPSYKVELSVKKIQLNWWIIGRMSTSENNIDGHMPAL